MKLYIYRMASEARPNGTKRNRPEYTENSIQTCINNIQSGKQTKYRACKTFGIPESTIRYRMSEKWTKKTRKGPNPVMGQEEETKIVRWLKDMQRKGFPATAQTLTAKIKAYCDQTEKPNPFKNNRPGKYLHY